MPDLPLTIEAGALPINWSGTPQEFLQIIAPRLRVVTGQAYSLFTSGAVLPSSDTGPHFLTTESTWYYYDYSVGSYQPLRLNSKSLRYIISNTEPSSTDYDIWYRVAADGTPLDIRKYQAGQWVAFPVDYDNITNKPNLAPIGEVVMFAGSVAPQDFLICNGQAVLRGQYADLYNVIGVTYGSGDGSTTFNLPDFRGRAPVGVGTGTETSANPTAWSLGQKRGAETHEIVRAELPEESLFTVASESYSDGGTTAPSETRPVARANFNDGDNGYRLRGAGTSDVASIGPTDPLGDGEAHNNIQPSIGINFIIRYQN